MNEVVRPKLSKEELLERKLDLAKERDTRVVVARVNDTHLLLDIARSLDKGINSMRKGMVTRYDAKTVVDLLDEFMTAARALDAVAAKICKLTQLPYSAPKQLRK